MLVSLGISFDKAERFSEYDRSVWLIALRQSRGEVFDWDQFRFVERPRKDTNAA